MRHRALGVAAAVLVLAAGCEPEPPPEQKAPPADGFSAGSRQIAAVLPASGAQNVPLRPKFRWRLPPAVPAPTHVSFTLVEVTGPGAPVSEDVEEEPLAKVTGLHDTSPTELELFKPPPGAVATGRIREMTDLAPETWYRWTVRVMGDRDYARRHFYFRTGPVSPPAAPASAP